MVRQPPQKVANYCHKSQVHILINKIEIYIHFVFIRKGTRKAFDPIFE